MEQRLIDANALRLGIDTVLADTKIHHKGRAVHRLMKNTPTVDVAPVVRCGECKFRKNQEECPILYFNQRELDEHDTSDTDFCSYGERILLQRHEL